MLYKYNNFEYMIHDLLMLSGFNIIDETILGGKNQAVCPTYQQMSRFCPIDDIHLDNGCARCVRKYYVNT